MEFEAVDEGVIGQIVVPEGSEGVKVGTVIAVMAERGWTTAPAPVAKAAPEPSPAPATQRPSRRCRTCACPSARAHASYRSLHRATAVKASPIARRLAQASGIDLATLTGTGPNGRIVKVDVEALLASRPLRRLRSASAPRLLPQLQHQLPSRRRISASRTRRSNSRHAQDHRAPPDRIEADRAAYLSHRRCPPRCASQAAYGAQCLARQPGSSSLSTTC
jgi:pyruvate/2-oxoglutarate dehydrogenase complex dihydrolipoamide acyltransferase (E2) component